MMNPHEVWKEREAFYAERERAARHEWHQRLQEILAARDEAALGTDTHAARKATTA